MLKIDLHLHSYYSDGQYAPEEVVKILLTKQISIFSLTEHNFVLKNTSAIKKLSKISNLVFIEGIEISALEKEINQSFHILGYSKNFQKINLNKDLQTIINSYNLRAEKIINKLNLEFPNINLIFEQIQKSNPEAYVSRNTLAQILVNFLDNKITIKEALKQYIFVEEDNSWMLTPAECFEKIKAADGISILAHSGRVLTKMGLNNYETMLQKFKEEGLDGIEVYYSKHSNQEISTLKEIALRNDLLITGGSDWHGEIYTPNIDLGVDMPQEDVDRFLNRVYN